MAGNASQTFTIPADNGTLAPEVLYLRAGPSRLDVVAELSVVVESLPQDAEIEVDLLRPGAHERSENSADWILSAQEYTTEGLQAVLGLAGWMGVRVRARSGGTAGTAAVSASWW